jgi:FtsP/CotA-like multicopper oxidase with cupredoxin domain
MTGTLLKGGRMRRRAGALAIIAVLVGGAMSEGLWAQRRPQQLELSGAIRTYYIAADEVDWNYAPADHDHMTGKPYDERARYYTEKGPGRIGPIYRKAVYHEYTDASFTALKPRPAAWEHLGIVGPVIRAEVGDSIKVVFKNNARFPFSMHPHGVKYDEGSSGVAPVAPGATFTYTWEVEPSAGPQPGEPSSKLWLYHSHVNEQRDVAAGLVGPMLISAKGTTKPDGTPKDVAREFVVILYTINELDSQYLDDNIARFIDSPDPNIKKRSAVPAIVEIDGQPVNVGFGVGGTNLRETINGYMYGSTQGLTMTEGERVRWYLAGMGVFHIAHWHANTVTLAHSSVDTVPLLPAEMHTTDMIVRSPGTWMIHCHVEGHLAAGMYGHYTVEPAKKVRVMTRSR